MKFTTLGLLGLAGSGKDTVADWLVSKGFVKVALADPMKRFVRDGFNISSTKLWGPSDLRNNEIEVGTGWWVDTVKRCLRVIDKELLSDVVPYHKKDMAYLAFLEWLGKLYRTYPTSISPRVILQTLGTEWGRSVDSDMWVNYGHRVAALIEQGKGYSQVTGLSDHIIIKTSRAAPKSTSMAFVEDIGVVRGVVIPDHRFKNEVDITQTKGGYVIKIRRLAQEAAEVGIVGHSSETEQKALPDETFDLITEFEEGLDKVNSTMENVYKSEAWKQRRAGEALS